jgi:hypothetical protein
MDAPNEKHPAERPREKKTSNFHKPNGEAHEKSSN